jgi:DNA-binding SARP family transcriptional activator
LSAATAVGRLQVAFELRDPTLRRDAVIELSRSEDPELAQIARASVAMCDASETGSLDEAALLLEDLLRLNRQRGHLRYEAITSANLALVERARGNASAAALLGEAAARLLLSVGSATDVASAQINAAQGLAHLGNWEEAGKLIASVSSAEARVDPCVLIEAADVMAAYGDPEPGVQLAAKALPGAQRGHDAPMCMIIAARLALAGGQPGQARQYLRRADGESFEPGFRISRLTVEAQINAAESCGSPNSPILVDQAIARAEQQGAWFSWRTLRLVRALGGDKSALNSHVGSLVAVEDRAHLSISAELVVRRLGDMDGQAFAIIQGEAALRPERWRWATRHLLDDPKARPADVRPAAEILDAIGTHEDIPRLRALAHLKALGSPEAGRDLIRRLAPRAFVDDLGRLEVRVGDRIVLSSEIRRKVVSLLSFLLTRPQFTASREQVMDALWPEMDPIQAANSLNQTAYFLRRVFEPNCDDDTTAGYLRARGDLIWLDSDLVSSRSSECLGLIAAMRNDRSPELAVKLAESYSGRFAVDFLYDDWSASFRDTLHASYLDRVEKAIQRDMTCGAFDRAITIAQHAIAVDPDAEQIELALLRLYRLTGAHAAAAEQYAHYATMMREQFGVEPPPLESL